MSIDRHFQRACAKFAEVHADEKVHAYACEQAEQAKDKGDAYVSGWVDGTRYCMMQLEEMLTPQQRAYASLLDALRPHPKT